MIHTSVVKSPCDPAFLHMEEMERVIGMQGLWPLGPLQCCVHWVAKELCCCVLEHGCGELKPGLKLSKPYSWQGLQ